MDQKNIKKLIATKKNNELQRFAGNYQKVISFSIDKGEIEENLKQKYKAEKLIAYTVQNQLFSGPTGTEVKIALAEDEEVQKILNERFFLYIKDKDEFKENFIQTACENIQKLSEMENLSEELKTQQSYKSIIEERLYKKALKNEKKKKKKKEELDITSTSTTIGKSSNKKFFSKFKSPFFSKSLKITAIESNTERVEGVIDLEEEEQKIKKLHEAFLNFDKLVREKTNIEKLNDNKELEFIRLSDEQDYVIDKIRDIFEKKEIKNIFSDDKDNIFKEAGKELFDLLDSGMEKTLSNPLDQEMRKRTEKFESIKKTFEELISQTENQENKNLSITRSVIQKGDLNKESTSEIKNEKPPKKNRLLRRIFNVGKKQNSNNESTKSIVNSIKKVEELENKSSKPDILENKVNSVATNVSNVEKINKQTLPFTSSTIDFFGDPLNISQETQFENLQSDNSLSVEEENKQNIIEEEKFESIELDSLSSVKEEENKTYNDLFEGFVKVNRDFEEYKTKNKNYIDFLDGKLDTLNEIENLLEVEIVATILKINTISEQNKKIEIEKCFKDDNTSGKKIKQLDFDRVYAIDTFKENWIENAPEKMLLPNPKPVSLFDVKTEIIKGGVIVTTFGFKSIKDGKYQTFTINNFTPDDLLAIRKEGLGAFFTKKQNNGRCSGSLMDAVNYDNDNRAKNTQTSSITPLKNINVDSECKKNFFNNLNKNKGTAENSRGIF